MSEEKQERKEGAIARGGRITLRSLGLVVLGLWVGVTVFWSTSERANVPFPAAEMRALDLWLVRGDPIGDTLDRHGENVSLFELYDAGWESSLLRTYISLVRPATWNTAEIGWGNIDWLGHLEALLAIALYTGLGLCALGALRIRWTWPVRLSVAYALGVGIAGWVFEQWAIFFLLSRWTVLVSLAVLFAGLGGVWWLRRQRGAPPDLGEPPVGKEFAEVWRDFVLRVSCWVLLGVLVLMGFYHAVCQPPQYWDGLILYLGYARQTHEAGGFPIKVVGQVGIGLGANYPHLFEVTQAAITRLTGHWSPLVGQWAAAWASLSATVLVYGIAWRVFRRGDAAILAALAFRAAPYMIAFTQWTSNYPLAILFTAAVLLAAYDWLATGRRAFALALLLLAAFASHVNYLMPALWGVALLALGLRWVWEWKNPREEPPHMRHRRLEPRAWRAVVVMAALAIALASSWYIRNEIVTGNPLYAFFHESLGGEHINPAVMRSADWEWRSNGDGLQMGNAWDNLMRVPPFLLYEPASSWKLSPLFTAFLFPGLILFVIGLCGWEKVRWLEGSERMLWWVLAFAVLGGMVLYHVAVSDIYLYQILPMMVPVAVIATIPLLFGGSLGQIVRLLFLFSVVTISIPFSLAGFKLISNLEYQLTLQGLSHPFPDEDLFYNRAFPGDVPIWETIREDYPGATLLTHDNRHLIYDEFAEIVHMDDWDVQPIYEIEDNQARLDFWRERGVDLYLRIPKERNHEANSWAGLQDLIDAGHLRLIPVPGAQGNALYAFPWTETQ